MQVASICYGKSLQVGPGLETEERFEGNDRLDQRDGWRGVGPLVPSLEECVYEVVSTELEDWKEPE